MSVKASVKTSVVFRCLGCFFKVSCRPWTGTVERERCTVDREQLSLLAPNLWGAGAASARSKLVTRGFITAQVYNPNDRSALGVKSCNERTNGSRENSVNRIKPFP